MFLNLRASFNTMHRDSSNVKFILNLLLQILRNFINI